MFETAASLWVSEEGPAGALGVVSHFVFGGTGWTLESETVFDALYPVYSITGRAEEDFGGRFFLYAASKRTVYRMDTVSRVISVVTSTPAGQTFRGVALPPQLGATGTPTPSPPPVRRRQR